MRVISPAVHGLLDYGVVLFLLLAPGLFNLTEVPGTALYILAAILGLLTLLTRFPTGLVKTIPVRVHGGIDLVTGVVIAALPWVLGFADEATARTLFLALAAGLVLVWLLTDWREPEDRRAALR